MIFDTGNLSKEVFELYQEVLNNLGNRTLQIIMEKPTGSFGNLGGYQYDGKGNYTIQINPESYTEYVLSHELLHIYIKTKDILPNLISFAHRIEDISKAVAILMSDSMHHGWIIKEQRRRGIRGEEEFTNEYINNILTCKDKESNDLGSDFQIISLIYTFVSDYPELIDRVSESIHKKYPHSYEKVKELLADKLDAEIIPPFNARRFIIKQIDKWIKIFHKDGYDYECMKKEIIVLPTFSETQLERVAAGQLGFSKREAEYFLYTKIDKQRCSGGYNVNAEVINQARRGSTVESLKSFLNQLKIPYYLDDRKGKWEHII